MVKIALIITARIDHEGMDWIIHGGKRIQMGSIMLVSTINHEVQMGINHDDEDWIMRMQMGSIITVKM